MCSSKPHVGHILEKNWNVTEWETDGLTARGQRGGGGSPGGKEKSRKRKKKRTGKF